MNGNSTVNEPEVMVQSREPQFSRTQCIHCLKEVEFPIPDETGPKIVHIKCYSETCGAVLEYNVLTKKVVKPSSSTSRRHFKIGSDKDPISTEYYELLGVPATATTDEIKKKYYRLAMQFHPDKNDSPDAEEKFKKISEAYQVLSDPVLRKKYNEYGPGKSSDPEGGFMDPEEFFKQQFGGEMFIDIIGELSLGKDFKNVMARGNGSEDGDSESLEGGDGNGTTQTEAGLKNKSYEKRLQEMEERKKVRDERVQELAQKLIKKLEKYEKTPAGEKRFKDFITEEAGELKVQNMGIPLLQSIGFMYSAKANEFLSREEFLGISSFFQVMKLKGRAFSNTVSTVKTAVDVHKTFVQLQEAEKAGMTSDERDKLEEEAARKGMNALWKGSKLEVESVIRSVCDRVLDTKTTPKEEALRRAQGLKIIGDIYQKTAAEVNVSELPFQSQFYAPS